MHATAHGGCTNTSRKSALKTDSGGKIPCRTGESNPRQCDACFFSPVLYDLRFATTVWLRDGAAYAAAAGFLTSGEVHLSTGIPSSSRVFIIYNYVFLSEACL